MPRRSISSTEKAVETTPVERRSTRASTRRSIEGTPDVVTRTPEKQKTEKSPAVKGSPAQGKRGRPSKRQSAAAVDDNEQATVEETKMDVDNDKTVAKISSEPAEAEKVVDAASNPAEKSEVQEDAAEKNTVSEKVDDQEGSAENKKRQREDSEEASIKKLRPEDAADEEKEAVSESKEEVAESAKGDTNESSGDSVVSQEGNSLPTSTELKTVESEAALNGAETVPSKEKTVADVPSKKIPVSDDSEVVQTGEDTKQNGCRETAAEPTAHVGC